MHVLPACLSVLHICAFPVVVRRGCATSGSVVTDWLWDTTVGLECDLQGAVFNLVFYFFK